MPSKIPMRRKVTKQQPGWKTLFLMSGKLPADDADGINEFEVLDWEYPPRISDPAKQFWLQEREPLLKAWIKSHPGTRPFGWWRYDAREPRQQIGGSGLPLSEVTTVRSTYRLGIPDRWVSASFFKSSASQRIEEARIDLDDPPVFESQAAYLDRLGMLSEFERSKACFVPEILKIDSGTGRIIL